MDLNQGQAQQASGYDATGAGYDAQSAAYWGTSYNYWGQDNNSYWNNYNYGYGAEGYGAEGYGYGGYGDGNNYWNYDSGYGGNSSTWNWPQNNTEESMQTDQGANSSGWNWSQNQGGPTAKHGGNPYPQQGRGGFTGSNRGNTGGHGYGPVRNRGNLRGGKNLGAKGAAGGHFPQNQTQQDGVSSSTQEQNGSPEDKESENTPSVGSSGRMGTLANLDLSKDLQGSSSGRMGTMSGIKNHSNQSQNQQLSGRWDAQSNRFQHQMQTQPAGRRWGPMSNVAQQQNKAGGGGHSDMPMDTSAPGTGNKKDKKPFVPNLEVDNLWPEFGEKPKTLEQKMDRLVTLVRNAQHKKNPIETLNAFLGRKGCDMTITTAIVQVRNEPGNTLFTCDLFFGEYFMAHGSDKTKKAARADAYKKALDLLRVKSHVEILRGHPKYDRQQVVGAEVNTIHTTFKESANAIDSNVSHLAGSRQNRGPKEIFSFIILEHKHIGPERGQNAPYILRTSADFSHYLIEFSYDIFLSKDESEILTRCKVKLEDKIIAVGIEPTRAEAKNTASEKALELLYQICWTIVNKEVVDHDSLLDKFQLLDTKPDKDPKELDTTIREDNIGHQMLAKMGWKGGGIGKEGEGIEDPIAVDELYGKEGLGLRSESSIPEIFRQKVKELLQNYQEGDSLDNIVFDPMLKKEERMEIHNVTKKMGLKFQTRKHGIQVFAIVGRKMGAQELLAFLQQKGGSTKKYELLAPGTRRTFVWEK